MHSSGAYGALPLLYIDDSDNDRRLVEVAISLTKTPFVFHQADCIESAIPYFDPQCNGADALPLPALVLLDYDLGTNTGADFLYWLRTLKEITFIPVVMFSGSPGGPHIDKCYAAGANFFISKPKDLDRLKAIVRALYSSLVSGDNHPSPILHLEEYQRDPRKEAPVGSGTF